MVAWPIRIVTVHGPSMVPALRHGDRLLVRLLASASRSNPPVGRVVIVELPDGTLAVKRLVAVESGGAIRVEGDNPYGSTDSRTLGPLPRSSLRGLVLVRIWPRPGPIRPAKAV